MVISYLEVTDMTEQEKLTGFLEDLGVKVGVVRPNAIEGQYGCTQFDEYGLPLKVLIADDADLSTWIHETAHVLLEHGRRFPDGPGYAWIRGDKDPYYSDPGETEAEAVAQIVGGNSPDPRFTGEIDADRVTQAILTIQELLLDSPVTV